MKPVQVMFDEDLLQRLDASPEVREHGRSAVLRQAAAEFLVRRRRAEISEAYRRGYKDARDLGEEWSGWEEEGAKGLIRIEPDRAGARPD